MHEGNPASGCSLPRDLVNQSVSRCPTGFNGRIEIRHAIADVVYAGTSLGQKPSDRAVGLDRREEFHLGISEGKRQDGGPINHFRRMWLQTKNLAIEGECGRKIRYGDADMSDTGAVSQ